MTRCDFITMGVALYIIAQGTFRWWLVLIALALIGAGLTITTGEKKVQMTG